MKLSVEELMRPRYEVIADYPGSKFKVGSIMIFIKNFMHRVNGNPGSERYSDVFKSGNAIMFAQGPNGIHLYPHLFKPLQWWERREASEMPEYVWYDETALGEKKKLIVLHIDKWIIEPDGEIWAEVQGDIIGFATCHMPKPSTPDEYSSYKQSIKS